jgi:hypothetical protein
MTTDHRTSLFPFAAPGDSGGEQTFTGSIFNY